MEISFGILQDMYPRSKLKSVLVAEEEPKQSKLTPIQKSKLIRIQEAQRAKGNNRKRKRTSGKIAYISKVIENVRYHG